MKHCLYKTTNLLNNRFYVGMHSTKNVDDEYLGSGRRLKAEIRKYGRENFKKEILEVLPSRKALEEREAEIVNEELLKHPLCLNLKNGGEGGGHFWSKEHMLKAQAASHSIRTPESRSRVSSKGFRTRWSKDRPAMLASIIPNQAKATKAAAQPKVGAKRKRTMAERGHAQGAKNSQYGTCWVTDGGKPIKIPKDQLDEYLAKGYRRGRIGV